MWNWALVAVALFALIGVFAPTQLPVVAYKAALVALFATVGYWVDRGLFPYGRPHEHFVDGHHMIGALLMLRRAAVIVACVVGGTLGV